MFIQDDRFQLAPEDHFMAQQEMPKDQKTPNRWNFEYDTQITNIGILFRALTFYPFYKDYIMKIVTEIQKYTNQF